MILADTSVWIDHLAHGNPVFMALLHAERVACHPAVIGELACGTFRDRKEVLHRMHSMPQILEAQHEEVLNLIDHHHLMGSGIGWTDAHLLAAAVLNDVELWTLDRALVRAADSLRVRFAD